MANRNIIQGRESEESVRQRAMNNAFKNFAVYGQRAIDSNREAEKTKRQIALQEKADRMNNLSTALTLSEKSGKTITTEDVNRFKNTGHFEEQLKEGEFGPQAPSGLDSLVEGISQKNRKALERKRKRENIADDYKKAQTYDLEEGRTKRASIKAEGIRRETLRKEERADEEKLKKLRVKGWELPKGSPYQPSEMEGRQFKDAISSGNAFGNNIKGIEDLLKKHKGVPSSIGSPNVHAKMRQKMTNAMLDLKGEAFFKLGVLAGPDMKLIEEAFGQIDSLLGTYQSGNLEVALDKLDGVKEYVQNRINEKAGSLGYVQSELSGGDDVSSLMSGRQKEAIAPEVMQQTRNHPEANEALKWAQNNLTDPRAFKIMQQFGEK